jgi:hypothetical protein
VYPSSAHPPANKINTSAVSLTRIHNRNAIATPLFFRDNPAGLLFHS